MAWLCVFLLVLIVLCSWGVAYLLLRAGFFDHPVEDEVVLISHAVEEVLEELTEVANVGLLLELETAAVIKVDTKLIWEVLRQRFDRSGQLLVPNLLVLLLLSTGGQALPWETSLVEIH